MVLLGKWVSRETVEPIWPRGGEVMRRKVGRGTVVLIAVPSASYCLRPLRIICIDSRWGRPFLSSCGRQWTIYVSVATASFHLVSVAGRVSKSSVEAYAYGGEMFLCKP